MIAGVCGGIAEFYKLDPSLVKIGIVVIGFITALIPMCILYAVMWAIVPEEV